MKDAGLSQECTAGDIKINRWHAWLIVLAVWAGVCLPGLGTPELQGEEARRVLPARTMLQTGNWIVPYIAGEPYYNKPPGINWPIALSFWLTGVQNELTARLPTVFGLLLFVSLIVLTRGDWLDLCGRLIASIVFLTSFYVIEKARLIEIEAIYVVLTGMAILCWLNVFSRKGCSWSLWCVPGLILGYSMLVKGPISVLVFYCAIVPVLVYERKIKSLLTVQHAACLLLTFGIVGLWYYLASRQGPDGGPGATLSSQMSSRLISGFDLTHWARNVAKSLINFLPWMLFLGALWDKQSLAMLSGTQRNGVKGLRVGVVAGFVLLNLMPNNEPRYAMPVVATASLALGLGLSAHRGFTSSDRTWRAVLLALAGSVMIASVAGLYFDHGPQGIVAVGISLGLGVILWKGRSRLHDVTSLTVVTGLITSAFLLLYGVFGLHFIHAQDKHRIARDVVAELMPEGEPIYAYATGFQPVLFYLREPLRYVSTVDQLGPEDRYLVLKKANLDQLTSEAGSPMIVKTTLHEFPFSRKGDLLLVELEKAP